ncbi:caspase 8-like protein, partial [Reticulomyxa filosa]
EEERKNEDERAVKKLITKEEKKKWMTWWKERNEKEKQEIWINSKHWIVNNQWKNYLKKENLFVICDVIDSYITYHTYEKSFYFYKKKKKKKNKKEKNDYEINQVIFYYHATAYLQINEREVSINLKELTFKELLVCSYNSLDNEEFNKLTTMKMNIMDMNENVIDSDMHILNALENGKMVFKITWSPLQQSSGKKKVIKNPLVVMIAISEYNEGFEWKNLKNVKERDVKNFKQLFEEELQYDFVSNNTPNMTQEEIKDYLDETILTKKLRKNVNKYDGLIMIICGHGDNGNVLVTSEGKAVSIDEIRASFDSYRMESLKDCPKIFIVDACRGRSAPHAIELRGFENKAKPHQIYGHNDDGFLTIWSTTKGHVVADSSLLSGSMKEVIIENYKEHTLNQMLHQIRDKIRKHKSGEWYCVESQDTTSYDIVFAANNRN